MLGGGIQCSSLLRCSGPLPLSRDGGRARSRSDRLRMVLGDAASVLARCPHGRRRRPLAARQEVLLPVVSRPLAAGSLRGEYGGKRSRRRQHRVWKKSTDLNGVPATTFETHFSVEKCGKCVGFATKSWRASRMCWNTSGRRGTKRSWAGMAMAKRWPLAALLPQRLHLPQRGGRLIDNSLAPSVGADGFRWAAHSD